MGKASFLMPKKCIYATEKAKVILLVLIHYIWKASFHMNEKTLIICKVLSRHICVTVYKHIVIIDGEFFISLLLVDIMSGNGEESSDDLTDPKHKERNRRARHVEEKTCKKSKTSNHVCFCVSTSLYKQGV